VTAAGAAARTLHLDDHRSRADLATYVGRAARADPDGAARLVLVRRPGASVLAVYVCPVHGGGGPTVLGLRTFALAASGLDADAGQLDVVVALSALSDRLARREASPVLAVPPAEVAGVVWAGISPPRAGWSEVGAVPARELAEVAHRGITEIAAGAPDVAGAPAVAALRARVWGRAVGTGGARLPAGSAFVAHVLGFLTPTPQDGDDLAVRAAGPWRRLTTPGGHVLSRPPVLAL
jgi:hypothetical protein